MAGFALIIILFLLLPMGMAETEAIPSPSNINYCEEKEDYACDTCEEGLQNKFNSFLDEITQQDLAQSIHWGNLKDDLPNDGENITFKNPRIQFDQALQRIIDIMKESNNGKLNYVVIGESESLQQTSIKKTGINPRIMLKSANSELMVTFSTDPTLPGYNSIEIMRWNAKEGRYEFQELNFGDQGEKPHIDLSGKKCMSCHKSPSMRPNWDTYRAWAGVVPSRDDMLEMHFKESNKVDKRRGMQPDAMAYMNFMEQIVEAKNDRQASSRSSRLAMLDIPFDGEDQLKEYVEGKDIQSLAPKEKLKIISKRIHDVGFYRVRHYPDKVDQESSRRMTLDSKTATKAGSSQFAFDQMLAQNMCRVATDLKKNPYFDEFKYALTGMAKCGVREYQDLTTFFPEGHGKKIKNYYLGQNGSSMRETPSSELRNISSKTPEEIYSMLERDTRNNQSKADDFKIARHSRFLENFLRSTKSIIRTSSRGRGPRGKIVSPKRAAEHYSSQITTPRQSGYHAISDPGGVRGVKEASTNKVVLTRFLLESYDVNVEHWSLVNGRDNAYHSYSFSDQFELFGRQEMFDEIWNDVQDEIGKDDDNAICQEIKKRSIAALQNSPIANSGDRKDCTALGDKVTLFTISNMASAKLIEQNAKSALTTCLTCHGNYQISGRKFEGLEEFVSTGDSDQFKQFLTSKSPKHKISYLKVMEHKLGLHGPHDYGRDMPPSGFSDNDKYKDQYQTNGLGQINKMRRKELATYLINLVNGSPQGGQCECNPSP